MKAVGLVLHPTKPVDRSVDTIIAGAHGHPVRVLAREVDRHRVPAEVDLVPDSEFVAEVDFVIALGGDGTMLGAMRLMVDRPVPVLGVNYGDLGFLVEVTPDGLPSALERLTIGDFTIEQRGCLEVDAEGVDPAWC
jgi:NAD+ kinase